MRRGRGQRRLLRTRFSPESRKAVELAGVVQCFLYFRLPLCERLVGLLFEFCMARSFVGNFEEDFIGSKGRGFCSKYI